MTFINRYTTTKNGSMIFTGNTIGLTRVGGQANVFITLDLGQQVPGYPAGTTLSWPENGSSAQLNIPAGSTILYAELQWGGTAIDTNGENVTAFIDDPITFITPLGSNSVSPDPVTAQEGNTGSIQFYSRSQDVTNLVSAASSGTYSVLGVPATITGSNGSVGWTLGVIYENPALSIQNMSIYAGIEPVTAGGEPVDFIISGFLSPPTGPVDARILVSAMEGDLSASGDQLLFGPDSGSLLPLSGPNNLVNNFFESYINDGDSESPTVGQLDTSGTFGNLNLPISPARYGWDITNVGSTNFLNSQTSATVRATTIGDGYSIGFFGVQLNAVLIDYGDAPDTSAGNGANNYSTLLANNGPRHGIVNNLTLGTQVTGEDDAYQNATATGDDISQGIQDDGPTFPITNIALNATTYTFPVDILNDTGSPANVYAWVDFNKDGIFQTNEGFVTVVASNPAVQSVNLNFTVPGATTLTVGSTFARVRVTTDLLTNTGGATGEDTRSLGLASDGEVEDYEVTIEDTMINSVKSVDPAFADIGDVITYTVELTNPGTLPISDVLFQDSTPTGTTYNNNLSVSTAFTGTNPQSGLTITNINPGETVTISWEVLVDNAIPTPNPISNTGNITIPNLPPTTTNRVETQINTAILTPVKTTDKDFADIGDEILHTITFTNTGNVDAENIVITDPLPNGTSLVPNSLNVNVPYTGDLENGVLLTNPVAPGGTVIISYRLLVDEIPNPNPIPNTATVDYEYLVDPAGPPVTQTVDSNTVTTQVNNATLTPQKTSDTEYADIGDEIFHTITFTNTGNVDAENVVITDPIPNGTSLVPGSLSVNVPYSGDLDNGIVLTNPVAPGEAIIISYRLLIEDIPNPNPIPNTATVDYEYTVDPAEPPVTKTTDSNTTTTEVNHAQIDPPVKTGNPSDIVQVGDTIDYSITFTNTGNVDAENVVITDPIRNGTSLVDGSLTVNVPFTGDLDNGIILTNPVAPGETIVVNYTLLVEEIPNPNPIVNTATVDYGYRVDPNEPLVTKSVDSNTVSILVNPVSITKTCTPSEASLTETITYNFTITNTSTVDITNVTFFDILPSGVTFVEDPL
ncbi:DUF7507 domain-containing protein [Clostridium sp. B9]|uniref:DUF7507 domain-containing protein n=1 Tax=Clostridium sp. B9 TaxID=3423224 RepID=UPI003D2F33C7